MHKYNYSPPKIKISTKLVDVLDEQGNVRCRFRRKYKNLLVRMINLWESFDWYAQVDVFSAEGELLYYCKKTSKWLGRPFYQVFNCKTNEVYHVTYTSWQKVAPEFVITGPSIELVMKKDFMDWARLYYEGREIARWKMKTSEWFKTYLEIEEDSPIQDPEFFIGFCQCIIYIGD